MYCYSLLAADGQRLDRVTRQALVAQIALEERNRNLTAENTQLSSTLSNVRSGELVPSAVVRQLERQLCAQDAKIGELAATASAASEAHADASAALEALQAAIEAEKVGS